MSLTATQRKRLAKAMRGLAMECVQARAPEMDGLFVSGEHGCAMSQIAIRIGLGESLSQPSLDICDLPAREFLSPVYEANDDARDKRDRHERLVFPLLALADALDPTP